MFFFIRLSVFVLLLGLGWVGSGRAQPAKLPDLVVASLEVVSGDVVPGQTITVRATLKNVGNAEARAGFNVRFHLSLAPDDVAITFGAPINDFTVSSQRVGRALKAGALREVTFSWTVVEVPLIRLRVTVDSPFDTVKESDERNNTTEKALFVDETLLNPWWLDATKVRQTQAITRGSADVVVAVVDTGIDWTHPELAGQLWVNPGEVPGNGVDDDQNGFVDDIHGWDFVDQDNNLGGTQRNLHATAVAGIIAAADDGVGTTGVAPGVRLMDLRVLDSRGFGSFSAIAAAIVYAVLNGAQVINLSLGAPQDAANLCPPTVRPICRTQLTPLLKEQQAAVDFARANGVVVVAAAGNESAGVGVPARFTGVLAVGATTESNALASYSNRGPEISVVAPGGDLSENQLKELFVFSAGNFDTIVPRLSSLLLTPYPGQGYGWFSGTSAAAPFVSGVVALMLSLNPALGPQRVQALLEQTALDLGPPGKDNDFGAGLLDAQAALKAAQATVR